MGHLVGKDIYRRLGKKIDGLSTRAPWNEKLYAVLKELYSADEAEVVVKMPYGLATREDVERISGIEPVKLRKLLESLCHKGLVMDAYIHGTCFYIPSPIIIGIFEFTMMRTGGDLESKEWARLFHDYLDDGDAFYRANLSHGEQVMPIRTLPHQEAFNAEDYVEVLDYEKAAAIIADSRRYAVGICSCRHEKHHLGEKKCDNPLESCLSFDTAADYLIRHQMGKEVSQGEMLEAVARARDLGLVLNADNVKQRVSFICTCCGCCCNVLLGISKFGYPNTVVTSNYIAARDEDDCIECGECVEACPINAIAAVNGGPPKIDESLCIGCGVCTLSCESDALRLVKRKQRVLHPEDTFEKIVLQCLERGTLQNQMFPNPRSVGHSFMRAFVGAFFKLPPVKKALMGDTLRSRFLSAMRKK